MSNNAQRRNAARKALRAHQLAKNGTLVDRVDASDAFVDLLADMAHYAEAMGWDFERKVSTALMHFKVER